MKPTRARLPANTQLRIRALVQRSAPDPERPRLSAELERTFQRVDSESAACYASAEELSFRLLREADRAEKIARDVAQVWPPHEDE